MNYRNFSGNNFQVSEIGFGAWGLGGDAYGAISKSHAKQLLLDAFKNGITFYDTADMYGDGRSEKLIGEVFKHKRDQVIIATKVGHEPGMGWDYPQNFSSEYIYTAIDKSLKRLKTDYVDVYQFHSPDISILDDPSVFEALLMLKKQGKIRVIGISTRSPDDALIAIKKYPFQSLQVNFNLMDLRILENGLLSETDKNDVAVIARTPLCFGYLAGFSTKDMSFDGKDHRNKWPKEKLQLWEYSSKQYEPFINQKNITPAQFALKFVLSYKSIQTVIPGMMNTYQVSENVATSDIAPLNEDDLRIIREIWDDSFSCDIKL